MDLLSVVSVVGVHLVVECSEVVKMRSASFSSLLDESVIAVGTCLSFRVVAELCFVFFCTSCGNIVLDGFVLRNASDSEVNVPRDATSVASNATGGLELIFSVGLDSRGFCVTGESEVNNSGCGASLDSTIEEERDVNILDTVASIDFNVAPEIDVIFSARDSSDPTTTGELELCFVGNVTPLGSNFFVERNGVFLVEVVSLDFCIPEEADESN
ncbi:hypothetical protein Y032_0013g2171 [Ancylostoma ceylanicum]|uniref:Uncharacterized protein n=1 Tax=Ancylostoma ceylanicum TaxID=53326 RepID=A0A016VB68_9BILA|nr:hypothetical protein Y032_0013g2171 [Ancylostoma ceylanicum]